LAMTANGWGCAKTQSGAINNCKMHMGDSRVRKYGYIVYHVHPDFRVSEIDGTIFTPQDHPPIMLLDKRKK